MNVLSHLKFRAAEQLIVSLARHEARDPPQVFLGGFLHNLKASLGFR
jgi:hypothetical protein